MDNILNQALDKVNALKEGAITLFQKDVLGGIKEYSIDKINEIWKQIEGATEVFAQTGYAVTTIDINLSIPPTLIIQFEQERNISDEEEQQLLESYQDQKLIYTILVALFKANALQQSIQSTQYKFYGLSISLGINPSIDMKFRKVSNNV